MMFIINDRTFNTVTSTAVAVSRGITKPRLDNSALHECDAAGVGRCCSDKEVRFDNVLYRTAKGAFFMHSHSTHKFVKGGRPWTTDKATELTPNEAVMWIEQSGAIVLGAADDHLPLPPEA